MKMYRKRFIPMETVDISGDEVVMRTSSLIVTKWLPIHKRKDISCGMSWTYLDEGYKISKFYGGEDGELLYYYCDIIDVQYDKDNDAYTFVDLLVDIKIFPDGRMEFLDFDELQIAYNKKLITSSQLLKAISNLNRLVQKINDKGIEQLCVL